MTTARTMPRMPLSPSPAVHGQRSEERGAVFTRRWMVDMILDLVGYLPEDWDLGDRRALEPAVGHGAFLIPMVERLLKSARKHGRNPLKLADCIVATDIDADAVATTREAVQATLRAEGLDAKGARLLAFAWVREADFLDPGPDVGVFDYACGNPPYVRLEAMNADSLGRYRELWSAMTGRADLYVGFLQAALEALKPGGRLGVICADRWMRNQYGAALREMIHRSCSLDFTLVLHDVDAFEDRVAAYPAVTLLSRTSQGPALVADADADFGATSAARLVKTYRRGVRRTRATQLVPAGEHFSAAWMDGWFDGAASWPSGRPEDLARVAGWQERFPSLTDTGVEMGVGIATGADGVFIREHRGNVEEDRLLRIVAGRHISDGHLRWAGQYLINVWDEGGQLVDLDGYPGLAAYLRRHKQALTGRFVAQRDPGRWWRTIDRVKPGLAESPKLLLPDLKQRLHPVLDEGGHYPGHSVYYLTSDSWDLEVLGGLLLTTMANAFIDAYSVRMANGYVRVTSQYLRRIHLPASESVPEDVAEALRDAFRHRNHQAADAAVVVIGDREAAPGPAVTGNGHTVAEGRSRPPGEARPRGRASTCKPGQHTTPARASRAGVVSTQEP